MEKRFDEQHAKIMKLHSTQKENETNLELLTAEKQAMAAQLEIVRSTENQTIKTTEHFSYEKNIITKKLFVKT